MKKSIGITISVVLVIFTILYLSMKYNDIHHIGAGDHYTDSTFRATAAGVKQMKMDSIEKSNTRIKDSIKDIDDFKNWCKENPKEYKIYLKAKKMGYDWSPSICERVARKNVWVGMTLKMVKFEFGLPDHINTTNVGDGEDYQYCYDDYNMYLYIKYSYKEHDFIVYSYQN